jgi:hypothetical protein
MVMVLSSLWRPEFAADDRRLPADAVLVFASLTTSPAENRLGGKGVDDRQRV